MNTSGDDKYPFENNPFDQNDPFEEIPSDDENNPAENNPSENKQRKGKGRKKIKMEKIENETSLQITFSKRRAGLFKKASELSTLTGAKSALIVFSPGGKAYSFGYPDVETVANRFLNANAPSSSHTDPLVMARNEANMRPRNQELTNMEAQLAQERQRKRELENLRKAGQTQNWAPPHLGEVNHEQLDQLRRSIMNLKQDFANKVRNSTSSSLENSYAQGLNSGAGIERSGRWTTPSGPTMDFPMGFNIQGQGPSNYQFPLSGQCRPPIFPDGQINPAIFGPRVGSASSANQTNPSGSSLLPGSPFVNPFDPTIGNYGFTVQHPHVVGAPSGSNVVFPPYNFGNPSNVVPHNVRPRSSSNVEPDGEHTDSHVDDQNKFQGSNNKYGHGNNP